jgi:hypothetical protein
LTSVPAASRGRATCMHALPRAAWTEDTFSLGCQGLSAKQKSQIWRFNDGQPWTPKKPRNMRSDNQ